MCCKCGKNFNLSHECKRQLLNMEGLNEEKEEEVVEEIEIIHEEVQGDEGGEISFNALKGCPTREIIKMKGMAGKRRLMVLIDSGSTQLLG